MAAPIEALLENLTEPQREAVTHVDGPLLVLAGPGSGKTRVITSRIAHLILEVGIAPWNVLAITFTNKAAGEMRQRVGEFLSARQAQAATVATFHSLCARLLRTYAHVLNLPSSYSIYDTSDQQRCIKRVIEDLQINTKNFPPSKVLSSISSAKNELVDAEAFASMAGDFYSKKISQIYRGYEQALRRNNALDFDDLLFKTVTLLREHATVAEELRDRFQYILIDEYQDTNHAQFVIARALTGENRNICATGDPDQSIYRWRGADIRNILEFEKHYPDARVVRLEQNYRSTKSILGVADALIGRNTQRKHKALWTDNEVGEPVKIVTHATSQHEAAWVVDRVRDLHLAKGLNYSDMAVFYRTNSLSRVMEDALRDAAIPYQIARGTAFYDRKEIKDAVAYLRAIANPADEINLQRIINMPTRGIGDKTIKTLQAEAAARQLSLSDALDIANELPALSSRAVKAVREFAKLLATWREEAGIDDIPLPPADDDASASNGLDLRTFVERVITESGLHAHYAADESAPDEERIMNLGELVSSASQYEEEMIEMSTQPITLREKLEGFLERIALVADVDAVDNDSGSVTLMTLHAAKGLEFPVVFMVGVEEGLLPHSQSSGDEHEIEEERRLCFVGMTRAKRFLHLSHTNARSTFGRMEGAIPSRFLSEIRSDDVEWDDQSQHQESATPWGDFGRRQAASNFGSSSKFRPGQMVRHPQFGMGTVMLVEQDRARVAFKTGTKTLMLEYARLEIV